MIQNWEIFILLQRSAQKVTLERVEYVYVALFNNNSSKYVTI